MFFLEEKLSLSYGSDYFLLSIKLAIAANTLRPKALWYSTRGRKHENEKYAGVTPVDRGAPLPLPGRAGLVAGRRGLNGLDRNQMVEYCRRHNDERPRGKYSSLTYSQTAAQADSNVRNSKLVCGKVTFSKPIDSVSGALLSRLFNESVESNVTVQMYHPTVSHTDVANYVIDLRDVRVVAINQSRTLCMEPYRKRSPWSPGATRLLA
jgi:hypothetical protein